MSEKPAAPKNTGVRKSLYSPTIAQKMCEQLSEGIPLREICRQEGFPAWRTVYDWMWRDAELAAAIAHAREIGQDAIAEEIYRMVEKEPERIEDERGRSRVDSGHVQWVKVQAEIKLKLLAKWNPKRYGDRVTHAGDDDNPVVVENHMNVFGELLKNLKMQRQSE
jgi:hypothetical protein